MTKVYTKQNMKLKEKTNCRISKTALQNLCCLEFHCDDTKSVVKRENSWISKTDLQNFVVSNFTVMTLHGEVQRKWPCVDWELCLCYMSWFRKKYTSGEQIATFLCCGECGDQIHTGFSEVKCVPPQACNLLTNYKPYSVWRGRIWNRSRYRKTSTNTDSLNSS